MSSEKSKKIRTLIVDDELIARQTIRDLLLPDDEIEIIGECGSGLDAVEFIRLQRPDLLFLDIQMPGLTGFEVLARLDQMRLPAVVFVTAFDHYALKAFEVHALDYLLKPFTDQRFRQALQQAKEKIELQKINQLSQGLLALLKEHAPSEALTAKHKGFLTRIMVRLGGRTLFLNTEEIDWISAEDYYAKLHSGGKAYLLRMSMNDLEEKLDPRHFVRIHRSTIVNFDRVKEMHQHPNGESVLILKNGIELKLSRSRRERLQELLMSNQ